MTFKNRENCYWLNQTVRDTIKILRLFAETSYRPATINEVAQLTGLPVDFCEECVLTLAFERVLLESAAGFQSQTCGGEKQLGLDLRPLDARGVQGLLRTFEDCGQAVPRFREPTGEWAS